jgi:hypothetical protein
MNLQKLVQEKISSFSTGAEAAEYFGVSAPLVSTWKSGATMPPLRAAQKVLDEAPETSAPAPVVMPQLEIVEPIAPPDPVEGSEQVYLGMPLYTDVSKLTFITLVRSMKLYGMEKVSIIPVARTLIDEARNTIVQRFMKTGAKYLVFVDSDMILPCGSGPILKKMGLDLPEPKASRNALTRIMSHPESVKIVGALYLNRRGTQMPAVEIAYRFAQEASRLRGLMEGKTKTDSLEETGWIGFGMVRIHRSVFEEMQNAAAQGGPLADIAPPVGRESDAFGYFGRTSQYRGEDVAFCRRAGKIGIKTYVDTGLLCGHQGERYNLT